MKTKKIILLSILPVFFLCTQRQAVLGVNLQAKTNCILKAAQTNDDAEIIEAIKEATKTSNDITDNMIKIQGFNADSVYINWLSSEGSSLRSNNEKLLKYLDEFRYRNPKIISYFQEYSEKDYTLDNLSKILQSKSELEIHELTYIDDFVIDEGMHDFIKERNGGAFVYNFGYSEPKTILNPDYLKVYSVYDEVLNDKENTADDEASSLSLGNTAIISLTTLLYNIGLSKTAVETIKNALLALRSVIRYFVPFKVRVAIIVGIITVAAIAIIVNWAQISCIMDAILDAFLSIAGQFNDCIKETFSTVIDRAEASSGTENITIDGKTITMHKLTTAAYAKTLDSYGEKVYHHAVINDTKEYVLVSPKNLSKKEAISILKKNKPGNSLKYNTYTYKQKRAKEVLKATIGINALILDMNATGHGWFLPHYHCDKPGNYGLGNPHSFFGIPVKIEKN